MIKRKTLLTILFSVLVVMLPLTAFASASSDWFLPVSKEGHTIAIANFADKELELDDEIYISIKEKDNSGNDITEQEIWFYDYGSPFGNYVISQAVTDSKVENGHEITFTIYENKEAYENDVDKTDEEGYLTRLDKESGIRIEGGEVRNNRLVITKEKVGDFRGEAYAVFTARKYLYTQDGVDEYQELVLSAPIVVADRVIDEVEDWEAIRTYAYAGVANVSGPWLTDGATNASKLLTAGSINHYQYYFGYWVLATDIDCKNQFTGIGGYTSNVTVNGSSVTLGTYGTVVNSVFDGRGHTLSNFTVSRHAGGLFSFMKNSVVKNLNIVNATMKEMGSVIATSINDSFSANESSAFADKPNFNKNSNGANNGSLIENVMVYGTIGNASETHTPRALIAGKTEYGTVRNCVAILDDHRLSQGRDYASAEFSALLSTGATGTLKSNTTLSLTSGGVPATAGILCAYTTARTTVENCLAINLRVGPYEHTWVPAINEYYTGRVSSTNATLTTSNLYSSRLRCPESASGLEGGLKYGGWYTYKGTNTPSIFCGVTDNRFTQVGNTVHTIQGWDAYALWYKQYKDEEEGREIIDHLISSGNYYEFDIDGDGEKEVVPMAQGDYARSFFTQNVSAARTFVRDGETVVRDEQYIINNDVSMSIGHGGIVTLGEGDSASDYIIGGDENYSYSNVSDTGSSYAGQHVYRDWYTLYRAEAYVRINGWYDSNGNRNPHAQSISVSTILDQYYDAKAGNVSKNMMVKPDGVESWMKNLWRGWDSYGSENVDPVKVLDGYLAGSIADATMPEARTYGRYVELESINRGGKAKVTATCMLDFTADGDEVVNIFSVDDCVNSSEDLVTAIGNFYIDAQQESIQTDGSGNATITVYDNSVTFNFDKTYKIPNTITAPTDTNGNGVIDDAEISKTDGNDYRYHSGLLVYNSAADGLTAQDVYFVHGTSGEMTQLPFDWYDGNLTVYEEGNEVRNSVYKYTGCLFNLDNAGETPHYLLVRFYHRFNEKNVTDGGSVVDALIEIKLPITIASKIYTTKEELSTFHKYALREKTGQYSTSQSCTLLNDWTTDASGNFTNKTGTTVTLNLSNLIVAGANNVYYDGYYLLGNDIDMEGAAISSGWTWGTTVWNVNNYYVENVNGTWYASLTSRSKDHDTNTAGTQHGWQDLAGRGFLGIFDGRGYVIKNVTNGTNAGMFGNLGIGGVVKNVAFVNAEIKANSGFLAQRHHGHYENVYVLVNKVNIGTSLTNNMWGVFAGSAQGTSATLKNCFVQIKGDFNGDYSGYNDRVVDEANKNQYIDSSIFGCRSTGFTGASGRCDGLIMIGKGARPWTNDIGSFGWGNAPAYTMVSYTTTGGTSVGAQGIALSNDTRDAIKSSLYNYVGEESAGKIPFIIKDGTTYTSFTNDQGTGYFDECWDHNFWTLDSDGLPLPIRVDQNTVQDAIRFQDVAIGETTSVAFADDFYSDMVTQYQVIAIEPPIPDGVADGTISIDATGDLTLGADVPEGTKITVRCTLITEEVVDLNFEAKHITLYESEDFLIDKASNDYVIDLANIDVKDSDEIASINLSAQSNEIREIYVGRYRLTAGDGYTFDAQTGKITINRSAYDDYKQEFVCTIKTTINAETYELVRIQGDVYFYDMLIEDADDLDSFIADSQKRLGGFRNKTWMGTYILGNDIVYNENVYSAGHRTYPAVMGGYPTGMTRHGDGGIGFGGYFDGRGHTIDGLHIDKYNGALFGALAEGSEVRNFNLINARISASKAPLLSIGSSAGKIEDLYIHVYADDAATIVLQEDNYAQSIINRVFIDAKQRGNNELAVQNHLNINYNGTVDVFTVGEVTKFSHKIGTTGDRVDDVWALYKTYDDVVNGNSIVNDSVSGAFNFNTWTDVTDGYWQVVEVVEGLGLPVPKRFYKDHVLGKSVSYTYPESTVALNSTTQIESKDDYYTNYSTDKGYAISNRKITVGNATGSFNLISTSVIGGEPGTHKVNIAEISNYDSPEALDEYVMTDADNTIVVKMFNHLYDQSNGVGEYDVVVMREEFLRISSAFHQARSLTNYEYYGSEGYIENGYTHKEVLVLDKTNLNGVDYGEVILSVPYYVYTPDTTFDSNGNILTGSLKKVVNLNLQIDLITAQIATASDLDKFWDYATNVAENVVIVNDATMGETVSSYGGYFTLVDNIIYDKEWDTRCHWSTTSANAGYWGSYDYGFRGIFDGRGYVINGIVLDTKDDDGTGPDNDFGVAGMFGMFGNDSIVRDVAFTNVTMPSSSSLFAAKSAGNFENIYVHVSQFTGFGTNNNGTGVFAGSTSSADLKIRNAFVEVSPRTGVSGTDYFTAGSLFNQATSPDAYYSFSSVLGGIYGSALENVLVINTGTNDYHSIGSNTYVPIMFQDAGLRHGNNFRGVSPFKNNYALDWDTQKGNYDFNAKNAVSFAYRNVGDYNGVSTALTSGGTEYYGTDAINSAERTYATSESTWKSKGIDRLSFVANFTNDESGVWTLDKLPGDDGRLPIFKQLAFNGESLTLGRVQNGETHTLALTNRIITRIATWSIVSGNATVNGNKITITGTGDIVIRATTRYGYKDFTITVYQEGYVRGVDQEMSGVDDSTTIALTATGTVQNVTLGGNAVTGYTFTSGESIVIPKSAYPASFGKHLLEVTTNDGVSNTVTQIYVDYATMVISNKDDLQRFSTLSRSSSWGLGELYVIDADIDMQGEDYSINVNTNGSNGDGTLGFRGTFDGRGHAIKNINITQNGFISGVQKDGMLKNVSFLNATQDSVGFIGNHYQGGGIQNLYIQVTPSETAECVFGDCNYADAKIKNVVVDVPSKSGAYYLNWNQYNKNYGSFVDVYGIGLNNEHADQVSPKDPPYVSGTMDSVFVFNDYEHFTKPTYDINGNAISYADMDNDFWDIANGVPVPAKHKGVLPVINNVGSTTVSCGDTITVDFEPVPYGRLSLYDGTQGVTVNGNTITIGDAAQGQTFTVQYVSNVRGEKATRTYTVRPLNIQRSEVTSKSIDLYLIAGQSNAAGNAVFNVDSMRSKDKTLITGNPDVLISATHGNYVLSNMKAGYGEGSNKIGAEAGITNYLTSLTTGSGENLKFTYDADEGRYAGIVKTAVGGTGFDYATDNASWMQSAGWWGSPTWISDNGYNTMATPVRNLYDEFVNNIVNTVNTLKADGFDTIKIKGLFWMQGERHIGTWGQEDATANNTYYKAFNAFITDLRGELNTKIGSTISQDLTGMEVLIGEVAETFGFAHGYTLAGNQKFIAVQNFIANNIDNVDIISNQDLPLNRTIAGKNHILGSLYSDDYHWGEDAMFTIGKRVGEHMYLNF